MIQIFDKNMLFNECIGLLIKYDEIDMEHIINQLEISYFSQENDYRRKILESFNRDNNQYYKLLKICLIKREEYLNNLLNDNSKCIFLNYALTDLCNFTLLYYFECMDENNLLTKIKQTLNSIKYLNSEWFKSITSCRNKFYVYYSDLLILSCAYHYKKLCDNTITEIIKELILNKTFEKMLYENDYASLSTIKKSIL